MPRSIDEFVRARRLDRKRAACRVCKVSPAIRAQIVQARRSTKIRIVEIVEWLKAEHGVVLTPAQIRMHYGGQHDGPAGMTTR